SEGCPCSRRTSPNTAATARSTRSRSGREEHSTARSASREASRELGSIASSARCAASSSPTPTREPCARWAAVRALSRALTASAASDTLEHLPLTNPDHVLVHLQRRPQRLVQRRVLPDRGQRL